MRETQTPSRLPRNAGFLPGRMGWGTGATCKKRIWGPDSLSSCPGTSPGQHVCTWSCSRHLSGLWLPALITAFLTHFLFGSWQDPLRGATDNEQLAAEPPTTGTLTPEQAWAGPPRRAEGLQRSLFSVLPCTHIWPHPWPGISWALLAHFQGQGAHCLTDSLLTSRQYRCLEAHLKPDYPSASSC